jgi:hypothetical protein
MAGVQTRGGSRAGSGRFLPVAYVGLAVAAAALLLPTALRPPVDQQSASAAFSPDAPPDDTPPEALLQSIRQASSSTAGGRVEPVPPPEQETVVIEDAPPPAKKKAVRNRCFGEDPPRQTESLYSATCVPAWTGTDNGGATADGVTAQEVRIGYGVGQSSTVPEGPLEDEFKETDSDDTHDLKVWQAYFNSRFEMFGRHLRLVIGQQSITDTDQQRQSVQKFEGENVFAITAPAYGQPSAAQAETVRRKLIDFGTVLAPCAYFEDNHPYAYSFIIDGCRALRLHSELICKQFGSQSPPGLLNEKQDLTFDYTKPRVYGLVVYEDEVHHGAVEGYQDLLSKCGITLAKSQTFNLTTSQQDIAGTMAKMKQAGVTTVIVATEVYTPIVLTAEASKLVYYPEWIQMGLEIAASTRLYDKDQARHMVGTAGLEIPRAEADTDWYRAYKEIDPDGDPAEGAFRSLQMIAGGIQGAGERLTPESFWQGLSKIPNRVPEPIWSIGGGFGPNDYTYMDYGSLIWWDPDGVDPNSTSKGSWQFVHFGKRYKEGEIPTDPVPWFDRTQSFTSPPKGVQG